jgi:8-oxo-dGTP pyrophosphatase MutT (NUDIX family)
VGYPHPTYDVPGDDEAMARLAESSLTDPLGDAARLAAGLRGADVPAGHVCATAWVLDPTGQRTLLVRHRALGWVEPGGHVERGESPVRAAARELAEETGLAARPVFDAPALVHAAEFPARADHGAHHHWNIGYLFVVDEQTALHPEPDAPVAWFDVADLPRPAVPDLGVVLPVLARLLQAGANPR